MWKCKVAKCVVFGLVACLAIATLAAEELKSSADAAYGAFDPGRRPKAGWEWVQAIEVRQPALRAEVKGDVRVEFRAVGMTACRALCWQQPTEKEASPWGHDVDLAPEPKLDAEGNASFVLPADRFPSGPITVRILARNEETKKQDVRELQLFNLGGVAWKQGIPRADPPAAQGMTLAFADDFDGPLSISNDGKGTRYVAHKPGGGDFSGWPFVGPEGKRNPFSQRGTYLRIHAEKSAGDPKDRGSTGLIAPTEGQAGASYVKPPFYMECRFVAQSAPGTWPAFWTLGSRDEEKANARRPVDEMDAIEAYGGVGKGNPDGYGLYEVTTHFWNQKGPDGKPFAMAVPTHKTVDMTRVGGGSSWSTTFHTYGLLVTKADTVYYCDDVEVLRHPTNEVSKTARFFFMINYAIGGTSGWKVDLAREGEASDMWVDWVRVYRGE